MDNDKKILEEENSTQEIETPEDILKDLKENSVPKEKYEELSQKYNKLFKDVAERTFSSSEKQEPEKSEEEQRKEYERNIKLIGGQNNQVSDIEHARALLAIRDYRLAHGLGELFPDEPETMTEILKESIETADGNNEIFLASIGAWTAMGISTFLTL